MKYIIFVGDGMADYPMDELGGKTPLQAAKTPNIDFLVKKSRCGKLITIPKGMPTGSEVANLSIFGYNPKKCFTGRGPLEAPSVGVNLKESEIAMRCNLITEENGILKDYSSGHISSNDAKELISLVNKKLGTKDIRFYPGVSYRHLLVLNKNRFSHELICNAPHDFIGKKIKELLIMPKNDSAKETAEMLNKIILDSKPILESHPINKKRKEQSKNIANMIWPWSPGIKPNLKTFKELYGISGAVISAVDLIFGIGYYAGLDGIHVKGATGLYDTNYEGKADAAVEALKKYDFVYVHVEAPDEASHAGDLRLKIKTIEDLDKRLIGRVLEKIDMSNTTIAILPDHPTPIKVRTHVNDPVPFLIYSPAIEGDGIIRFNEFSVEKGSLGLIEGNEFIKLVLKK